MSAPGDRMFAVDADTYDRFIGRYSPALARKLIAAAGVQAGDRVLDVGCGPGALTGELVALLGSTNVAAVDPSQSFVAACRRRYPDVDVRQTGAEALPFDDEAFDAALAQLVVNFMDDAREGVAEMRRVTRPGGMVAAAVWDYGDGMTLLRSFWDAAAAANPAGAQRDERNVRFATQGELKDLWDDVGLERVEVSAAVVSAAYEGFEELWSPLEGGVGPAGAYTASLSAPARHALKLQLRNRLGVTDGPFELSARAWIVTGWVG